MYPWDKVEPEKDSTLRIIHECLKRKHRVVIATPAGLTMRNSTTNVFGKVLSLPSGPFPNTANSMYKKVKFKEKMLPLAGFDIIFMRANPPLDILMLNFLDSVKDDVFIVNDIQGLREANNKLYTASLDDSSHDFIPATHVSKNKEYLKRVIMESEKEKMILKPLDGMGGRGVIVVEKSALQNMTSLLDFYIDSNDGSNYVILQEYIEGADQGDVRVILLNGEPIGAMRRVPADGDHRSNVSAGGSVKKHNLTKQEKEMCKVIGKRLVADGLYFVGLDIINGKLIEVNVCSPGGIVNINKLNKTRLQVKIVDFVENVVKYKSVAAKMKSEFREKVENA